MNFKDKAKRTVERGRADRANYIPDRDSAPLRMYQFWASVRPKKVPTRENFCHYWRVVVIWAPIWFVLFKTTNALENKTVRNLVFLMAALAVLSLIGFGGPVAWLAFGGILASCYTLVGIIFGAYYADEGYDEKNNGRIALAFTLPALVGIGLYHGIRKFKNRKRRVHLSEGAKDFVVRALFVLLMLAGGTVIALYAIVDLTAFLMALVLLAAFGLLVFALSYLASFLKNRRDASVKQRTTFVEKEEFGYIHTVAVVKPSRTAKFFIAIGDFLNLAFQVVRVKKWKICPIVEIPNGR